MPSKKKRKFIGKHEEKVSFYLVHRSQKDPLAADETAPQHVLQPIEDKHEIEKRKAEENKFGVFFDDNYNYLQHLRDLREVNPVELIEARSNAFKISSEKEVKLKLPSSVFASQVEETTGLLNKAAPRTGPQLDLDPDIVAALDDDFDFDNPDNQLEDDFVLCANASNDGETQEDGYSSDDKENHGEEGEMDSLYNACGRSGSPKHFEERYFESEETCSRFTDYSLSSAVIPRNSGLKGLDDRFEKLFEQYDECEIGSLDGDDVAGHVTVADAVFKQAFEDYQKHLSTSRCKNFLTDDKTNFVMHDSVDCEEEDYTAVVIEEPNEKWDCESILSTYSNLYNHPKLITEPAKLRPIQISKTKGFPLESVGERNLTKKGLKELEREFKTTNPSETSEKTCIIRKKTESPEEKKMRKMAVKELRKERRLEKKANSLAFKEEKKRQEKILFNLQQNIQGIKLM